MQEGAEMKRKSIWTLQIIVVALQALALIIALGFTAIQPLVKGVFASDSAVKEFFSIPVNCLITMIPMLLIYVLGLLLIGKTSGKSHKTTSAILLGLTIFLKIVSLYSDTVTNYFVARYGVVALASHTALERGIYLIANPLTWAAFALFCFACGGCFGSEEQS